MSLTLRDQYIKQCWVPAELRQPSTDPRGPHFPVTCWVVVDDPRYRVGTDMVFACIGCWWPASKQWTVTSRCPGDEDVTDVPVNVSFWQPMPPLPW